MKAMAEKTEQKTGDLEALKRLMILDLTQRGIRQKRIALALGISEATLSTMFPKGLLSEIRQLPGTGESR
jgi:DNA-binding NarL/FixJ family response regulator